MIKPKLFLAIFLAIAFMSVVSAVAILNPRFHLPVENLDLSKNLTFEKFIQLCTQESCVIDSQKKPITILSHYNNKVALTFSQSFNGGFEMDTRIPYDIAANDTNNEPFKNQIIRDVDPSQYNWTESIRTDLIYLRGIGVLDISDNDISKIIIAYYDKNPSVNKTAGDWIFSCDLIYKLVSENGIIGCIAEADVEAPSPILPLKEFVIENKVTPPINDDKKEQVIDNPKSNNFVYYIVIGIVVLAIILYLIFKKK